MQTLHKSFPDFVKLIGYVSFAAIVVWFNPFVGPSPKIRIFFCLLSTSREELLAAPKIMRFLLKLLSGNKNCECASNPIPCPLCAYLSGSEILLDFSDPNRQLPNAKSVCV